MSGNVTDVDAAGEQMMASPSRMAAMPFASELNEKKMTTQPDMTAFMQSDMASPDGGVQRRRASSTVMSFFSWNNFVLTIPNLVIPSLYGYHLGVAGVYITMYEYATNCHLYKAPRGCETLSGASCVWDTAAGECAWASGTTTCFRITNETICKDDAACAWDLKAKTCGNQVGYSAADKGLLACGMIIGAMVGSFAGGVLTKKLNYKLSFFLIGLISTIAAVLTHVSTAFFNFWLLFAARIILGVPMGWQAFAVPSYTSKFADKAHEKTLGTLFQVFIAFGAFISSIFALALGDTIRYDADVNANLKGRMHGFVAFPTLLSALTLLLPLVTRNETTHTGSSHNNNNNKEGDQAVSADERGGAVQDGHAEKRRAGVHDDYTWCDMVLPLFIGVCMAASVQLTGMLSVVTYAPTIMRVLGLDAFVGNIIVFGWSALVVMAVIPLSQRFSMRWLFITSTLLGSVCCLFLCGIPVYPGVSKSEKVKNGLAITGILLFIFVYLAGAGPCFYVLAIDVFPHSFRHYGSAVTVCINFVFNLLITLCYPIATEGISGGPSGNPDKGQAVAFIFFGCIGFITVAIEYFFMHPWDKRHPRTTDDVADVEPL